MCLHHQVVVKESVRRLGWLVLWLVARHSLRLWLDAPGSPETVAGADRLIRGPSHPVRGAFLD
ncbi:MAG: hypothetical protein ABJA98_12500 [Acidobacteriota bacterium]